MLTVMRMFLPAPYLGIKKESRGWWYSQLGIHPFSSRPTPLHPGRQHWTLTFLNQLKIIFSFRGVTFTKQKNKPKMASVFTLESDPISRQRPIKPGFSRQLQKCFFFARGFRDELPDYLWVTVTTKSTAPQKNVSLVFLPRRCSLRREKLIKSYQITGLFF